MPSATAEAEQLLAKARRLRELREAVELSRRPSLEQFVAHCLIVEKETGNLIPFDLWDDQHAALEQLVEYPFTVAAKGRQVGITWLVLALMDYEGTFGSNRSFPIARQSEEYAKDAIRRLLILVGYDPDSDPPNLRVLPESTMPAEWRPRIIAKNVTELRADNGSKWTAHTATQALGRGLIGYRGLADEFAFWPWPEKQRKAMESGCARLDIVSTGNGEGDDFHATWDLAVAHKGKYHALFIPATADPRRDEDWFRVNVLEDADPDGAMREYARKPEEAFRAPEGAYFKRFERARHVQDVEVQRSWTTFRSIDFGFRHPACLWEQVAPSGQVFVVDELLPENMTTTEFVQAIVERERSWDLGETPRASYCDPAGNAANVQTAQSEFEVLRSFRLNPKGKPSSIRDGCMRIMDALADTDLPLVIAERCAGTIRCLSQVKPDKSKPELYDQREDSPFQHALDALRYFYVNHKAGSAPFRPPGSGARTPRIGGRSTSF